MSDMGHLLSDREQMFQAAELNNLKLIEQLVKEKEMKVGITDYNGRTPAHIAAMYGHLNVVKFILEKDPSLIEVNDKSEESVLIKAITYGHLGVVKYLVENWKLSISQRYGQRHFGNTAIHFATTNGRLETLKYFIEERNGDVNIENDLRETPLFLAAENKLYRIIQYLVEERGADAIKINSKGYNVLFKAVEIDDLGLMKYLIDVRKIPFDLNWKGFSGDTLVHRAVELNRENILLYLVSEKQARVNIADDSGETPLHKAASKNNYRICRFLIEMGADVDIENESGKRPVHQATNERLIKYLREHAAHNEMRSRRNVFESSIPHPPVPPSPPSSYSIGNRFREVVQYSNNNFPVVAESFQSSSASKVRHHTSSLQFQNFLTIAMTIIKNHKSPINQRMKHKFFSSPREAIMSRMDQSAISAIWNVPNFRHH